MAKHMDENISIYGPNIWAGIYGPNMGGNIYAMLLKSALHGTLMYYSSQPINLNCLLMKHFEKTLHCAESIFV